MIEFNPIPSITGKGYTALTIYPPGEWFDSKEYNPFVGGGGIGSAATLEEAKEYLLQYAIGYCERQIKEAENIIAHYTICANKLRKSGLVEKNRVSD